MPPVRNTHGFPVLWAEETIAYSVGHGAALRLHAIPFAPLEAFGSLNPAQRWTTGVTLPGAAAYLLWDDE